MTVREIMTREYLGVSESDTVADAVDLMLEEEATAVVVLRGSDPVGMLTTTDALGLVTAADDPADVEVRSVMSGTVPSVDPDASVSEAAGAMADTAIGSLLVQPDGDVEGIVTEGDVVRAAATLADHPALSEPTDPAAGEPMVATAEADTPTDEVGEGEYSTQSVCEICGSLTPDLRNFNGQLICDNCREV